MFIRRGFGVYGRLISAAAFSSVNKSKIDQFAKHKSRTNGSLADFISSFPKRKTCDRDI